MKKKVTCESHWEAQVMAENKVDSGNQMQFSEMSGDKTVEFISEICANWRPATGQHDERKRRDEEYIPRLHLIAPDKLPYIY